MRVVVSCLWLAGCGRIGFGVAGGAGDGDGGLPPCTTSVCQCNTDLECSTHEYCSAHAGEHTCECVAGYGRTAGVCTWVGVVADPGLQDPSAWTTSGATIDPAFDQSGMVEPGAVPVVGGARVTQTITMPRLSRAEPLVVMVSSLAGSDGSGNVFPPSAGIGPGWHYFTSNDTMWLVERQCLGAGEFAPESSTGAGVAMTLQLMQGGAAVYTGTVDHVEIVPAMAGECLAPGPVSNGDAEGTGGWTFVVKPANDGTFSGFAAGVGANGSRGVRLYVANYCDNAGAGVGFAVPAPEQMPSPAVSVYVKATAGATVDLLSPIVGTGTPQTIVQCLPATQRGELGAFDGSISVGGTCGQSLGLEADLDDVTLFDDPACGSDPAIADPGFESMHLPAGASFFGTCTVGVTTNPADVHSGAAALRLGCTDTCGRAMSSTGIIVPSPSATGGAAVEFYYKGAASGQFGLSALGSATILTLDGAWHRGVACFNSALAGQPNTLFLDFSGTGSCKTVAESYAVIDDLAATTDPSCP